MSACTHLLNHMNVRVRDVGTLTRLSRSDKITETGVWMLGMTDHLNDPVNMFFLFVCLILFLGVCFLSQYSAVDTNPLSVYVMHPFWNFLVKVSKSCGRSIINEVSMNGIVCYGDLDSLF